MTDLIDTLLLKSGMPHAELCPIKMRRWLYAGIFTMGGLTLLSWALLIFAPLSA